MTNDEWRMMNDEIRRKIRITKSEWVRGPGSDPRCFGFREFIRHSSFVIRHFRPARPNDPGTRNEGRYLRCRRHLDSTVAVGRTRLCRGRRRTWGEKSFAGEIEQKIRD